MLRQPTKQFAVVAQSAKTATGNSGAIQLPEFDFDSIAYKLQVANANGNADIGLSLSIQTTDDGGTTWWDMVRFAKITASLATGTAHWAVIAADDNSRVPGVLTLGSIANGSAGVPHLSNLIRVAWEIAGTNPSFTIKIDAFLNSIGRGG